MSTNTGTPTAHVALPTMADADSPDLGAAGLGAILAAVDTQFFAPRLLVNPADKSATTSLTAIMLGLGAGVGGARITPAGTCRLAVVCVFRANAGNGNYQLAYGTGPAPANGDAASGTATGRLIAANNTLVVLLGLITGLTRTTTYWLDVQAFSSDGSSCQATSVQFAALEL